MRGEHEAQIGEGKWKRSFRKIENFLWKLDFKGGRTQRTYSSYSISLALAPGKEA